LTATVDLRGRRAGRIRLLIVVRTSAGKRTTLTRTYRTCVPRRASVKRKLKRAG